MKPRRDPSGEEKRRGGRPRSTGTVNVLCDCGAAFHLSPEGPSPEDVAGLVAFSESMHRQVEQAKLIARVDSTVLISGESGAGKERIAQLVHAHSARKDGPFIAVNCGAVSESLFESELFGHTRGSFTGATRSRPGLFEAACAGTLFLDEVGDVPLAMQVKLLRALQEREIRRVGENRSRPVDVRIVAATNRDLTGDVASKKFRQDLYYRLKVIEIRVPPLRERLQDILPLARLFLTEAAADMKRNVNSFSPEVVDRLLHYDWPGNVRELKNAVERGVALARGSRVEFDNLPREIRQASHAPAAHGFLRSLRDVERAHILATLDAHGGNRARAAEALEIGIATLNRKLKMFKRMAPPSGYAGPLRRKEDLRKSYAGPLRRKEDLESFREASTG